MVVFILNSANQELIQFLEHLQQSQQRVNNQSLEDINSSSASLSSHQAGLVERLKSLQALQATFGLSSESCTALAIHRREQCNTDSEFNDKPSMASSSAPSSDRFVPISPGVHFNGSEDDMPHINIVDVAQGEAFARKCSEEY